MKTKFIVSTLVLIMLSSPVVSAWCYRPCVEQCTPVVDVCENVEGNQAVVPEGMVIKDNICVEIPDDTPPVEEEPTPTPQPEPAPTPVVQPQVQAVVETQSTNFVGK